MTHSCFFVFFWVPKPIYHAGLVWQDVETIMLMELSHFNSCANVSLNHFFPPQQTKYILQLLENMLN